MAAYLANGSMTLFYDRRRITDLLTDDGTGDDLTDGNIAGSAILTAALTWASSEIDTKAKNGRRYSEADLVALAAGTSKPAATLQKLCADLAFGFLAERRAQSGDQLKELAPAYEEALVRLEELYQGRKVFDIESALDATVPTRFRLGKLANLSSHFNRMFGTWPADTNNLGPRGYY